MEALIGLAGVALAGGLVLKRNHAAGPSPMVVPAPDWGVTASQKRVIFDEHTARRNGILRGHDEFWMPTTNEIQALEEQLPGALQREVARWLEPEPPFDPPAPPLWERVLSYHRQYTGIVRAHRRIIDGNFFCDDVQRDLRQELVDVIGGGDCFFNVKYDVKERRILDLNINARK